MDWGPTLEQPGIRAPVDSRRTEPRKIANCQKVISLKVKVTGIGNTFFYTAFTVKIRILAYKLYRVQSIVNPITLWFSFLPAGGEADFWNISFSVKWFRALLKPLFFPPHVYFLPTGSFAFSVHQTLSPFFHSLHFSFVLCAGSKLSQWTAY